MELIYIERGTLPKANCIILTVVKNGATSVDMVENADDETD